MWRHTRRSWARRGWLRPWVLGILSRNPKNGAEIMDQIEQMSFGWRPSPGSIYPLLEGLVSEGLLRRREDGRYELTARGRETSLGPWELFARQSPTVETIVEEMRSNVAYLAYLRSCCSSQQTHHLNELRELGELLDRIASA